MRLRALLEDFDSEFFAFARRNKLDSAKRLLLLLRSRKHDVFVLEGTGIAGGSAAILGRILWNVPYIVSSGDAVAPFLGSRYPLGYPAFWLYEKLLCRLCTGFIGWTPYLVGRALTLGAPRAATVPGWAPSNPPEAELAVARRRIREQFGIPADAIVLGLVGSLNWTSRYGYCYGAELVRAALRAASGVHILIVGSGTGLEKLRDLAGDRLGKTIHLPGRVPRAEVPGYLAAMDMGSIPQSVDGVGSYRYTTKLMEYRAAHLPVITNQIPMAYDLDDGSIVRLEGSAPWDPRFVEALARLMKTVTPEEIGQRTAKVGQFFDFDRQTQVERATAFITEVIAVREGTKDHP